MQSMHSHGIAFALFAAAGLAVATGVHHGPAIVDDPVLTHHTPSLTTVKVAAATNVQDVRPLVGQRGVQLDGIVRSRPPQRMVIGGNPYEKAWRVPDVNGVRLDTGTYQLSDIDISLPASMPWLIGRSYNAHQQRVNTSHRDSNGPQGKNWFQSSQMEILLYDDATSAADDLLYVYYGADCFLEYKRTDASSSTFRGRNGAAGVVSYTAASGSEPETYTLYDQHGTEIWFIGFDGNASPADGQIWKLVDADGNTAFVGDSATASTAITNGFTASGRISKAYDSTDRRFSYTYDGSSDRLTQVKAETKSGGTWASPTGLSEVARVDYEYYGDESYGDTGDLKLVEITTPLTDSGVDLTSKRYYRYWEGTYNASTNPGHKHGPKYVVEFEGTRNQDWSDSNFDEDFLTLSNASLEPYASAYFEYDANHRINEAWFNGECGCAGAATGTYVFEYETNGSFSDTTSAYDEEWKTRTVVNRPNGSYLTQYFDEVCQPLSRVITDADPDNTTPTPDRWVTHITRDSNGNVTQIDSPASVSGYTHSTGAVTVSSSAGLVRTFTRESSGTQTGFVTAVKWKEGTSGTAYYEQELGYTSASMAVGADSNLIRPLRDTVHNYAKYKSTSTSDRVTTTTTTTVHSGEVAVQKILTTYPVVSTSENGSGSATTMEEHFNKDGDLAWTKAEDGIITYREYTNGQLTTLIEDADTGETGSGEDFENVTIPSGLSSSAGAVHRKTTYAYDPQGRTETQSRADGRVFKSYYTKLADARSVVLAYNDYDSGSSKYYGPVSYTVSNHTGKAEVEATVALTSNESTTALTGHVDETESDPIAAMDVGTIVRMTTSHYAEGGGTLEETRLYFDIPSSGAGTDGTNYDPTSFGYDDMGQRVRVKAPHGTIARSVYDINGRVIESWVGTNDSSFDGGESSGTDNMVKTEAMEYDSGVDDGNGHLTKHTAYVEDSATGSRVTSYTTDPLGNVLLEANPEAPHSFHKVDGRGRRIATGLYSSTASITVGTDDPLTESSNRLALQQTHYDAKGQVWKTTRHKIDPSDGSDDDSLVLLSWYDGVGRRIKFDGSQLEKRTYDRLGRETERFTLANDDDSTYADAGDVVGDIVLEEHQVRYESDNSDDVVLRVEIARHHDDYGVGETKGALDTNADSDDLLLTAANVSGRPQITAYWYDRFGRMTDQVHYGTYGGSNFDRSDLAVPSRSDTALLSENSYGTDGNVQDYTGPGGVTARTEYDDSGRVISQIRNYIDGTPTGPTGDDDVTTRFVYKDGLRTKIWVDLDGDDVVDVDDQETLYIYGTTTGTPSASEIATGHLLRATVYPDSTNTGTTEGDINSNSTDVVSHAYNAQSEEIYKKDQSGNVIEAEYSDTGELEKIKVSTLASGFDGAVRRLAWTYTDLGQVDKVTSYDAVTSGSVVNEVDYSYDGWGMVTSLKQDKDGTVGGSGYYEVAYTWAKATGGRNTVRRTGMTLPSGNVITYKYSSQAAKHDDEASRVLSIKDGAVVLAEYAYNGLDQVVRTDYGQPNIMWEMHGTTTGSYPDLDRFNRVTSSRWTSDLASDVDFFDLDVSYDRESNITVVQDNVHAGFDWAFEVDSLDRIDRAERGTWNGSAISSQKEDQTWTLTQLGNWDHVTLDFNADDVYTGSGEYDDDRTYNKANELTARDVDDSGVDDFSLVFDAVGNLTDDAERYEYVYDALGRLRKINDQASALVAEYEYNGLGQLIGFHEDTDLDSDVDGDDKWFYAIYDERWRMVASYRDSDADPKEEWVHHEAGADGHGGSSFVNGFILRDRDADTAWDSASDGTLEERMYACQNWRGDVSSLVYASGDQVEQVRYTPYGVAIGMPGGDCDSDGDNDNGDTVDSDQIQTWINASSYDVRADLDLDGDVDSTDRSMSLSSYSGVLLGRDVGSNYKNRRLYMGAFAQTANIVGSRKRMFDVELGAWGRRDEYSYGDGMNLYEYVRGRPVAYVDTNGLQGVGAGTISPSGQDIIGPLPPPPPPPPTWTPPPGVPAVINNPPPPPGGGPIVGRNGGKTVVNCPGHIDVITWVSCSVASGGGSIGFGLQCNLQFEQQFYEATLDYKCEWTCDGEWTMGPGEFIPWCFMFTLGNPPTWQTLNCSAPVMFYGLGAYHCEGPWVVDVHCGCPLLPETMPLLGSASDF